MKLKNVLRAYFIGVHQLPVIIKQWNNGRPKLVYAEDRLATLELEEHDEIYMPVLAMRVEDVRVARPANPQQVYVGFAWNTPNGNRRVVFEVDGQYCHCFEYRPDGTKNVVSVLTERIPQINIEYDVHQELKAVRWKARQDPLPF